MSSLCVPARILRGLLIAAVFAVVIAFPGDRAAKATSFSPIVSGSLADSSPGASSDATVNFSLEAPDSQFGGVIAFTPKEFAADTSTSAPLGAIASQLKARSTLGLIGLSCSTPIDQSITTFNMMIASTNIDDVLPDAYGLDYGRNVGDANDQFDIVNGLPLGVTKYPDYLKRILIDDKGVPLKPKIRLYGQVQVSMAWVSLNFAQFEPGINYRGNQLDPALGNPSVVTLLNIGDPLMRIYPNPITDFCSPLSTTTTIYSSTHDNPDTSANEGGTVLTKNPSTDSSYNFTLFAVSMADSDDDGIENFLDSCPFQATPGWDGRDPANPGDQDGDGLPDACDPTPTSNLPVNDADSDNYVNRGDNCPLDVNGLNAGGDGLYGTNDDIILGSNNQADSDNDLIGDSCDPNPTARDGHVHIVCSSYTVKIGAGGTAPSAPNVCTESRIGVDLDNDGVFDSLAATGGGGGGDGGGGDGGTTSNTGATPTPRPGTTGPGGVGGGPSSGIGTLSPTAASIPAWAAIAVGLGGAGLLGSLGALASRRLRRRR